VRLKLNVDDVEGSPRETPCGSDAKSPFQKSNFVHLQVHPAPGASFDSVWKKKKKKKKKKGYHEYITPWRIEHQKQQPRRK
jgi:hypothetical protein